MKELLNCFARYEQSNWL